MAQHLPQTASARVAQDAAADETRMSALPKFIQLSEMLIRDIAAGRLVDGARLPPERDMADDLGVAVGTLRRALADVEAKGLLERVQGSGNYVRHRPVVESVYAFFRLEKVDGGGLPTARVLSVDRLDKPEPFARLGGTAQAHRIRRLRALDGQIVALEEIWLDGAYASQVTVGDLSESLYHYYRHELGLVIAFVEDQVGLSAVPAWADPQFRLLPGTACGHITRFSRATDRAVAEFSQTWFDSARARYVSRMGKG